jgi:hypothetical protein
MLIPPFFFRVKVTYGCRHAEYFAGAYITMFLATICSNIGLPPTVQF